MKTLCLAFLIALASVASAAQVLTLRTAAGHELSDGTLADFGTIDVGGLKTLSFTVTNVSGAALSNVLWTLDGRDPSDFVLDASGCTSLAVGASGVVRVSFLASVEGKVSQADLHARTASGEVAGFDLNLTAKAGLKRLPVRIEEVSGAEFTALSPAYDFGQPMLGQTGYKTFRLTNLGTAPLRPVSLQIDEVSHHRLPWRMYIPEYQGYTEQSGFWLWTPSLSTLSPGESATFTVRWSPYETTTKLKHVVITGDNLAVLGGSDPALPVVHDFGAETSPTGQVMIPITGGAVENVVPPSALAGLHYRMGTDSYAAGVIDEKAVSPEGSELEPDSLRRWTADTSSPATPVWGWHQLAAGALQLHANNARTPPFPSSTPITGTTAATKLNSIAATSFHDGVWHSNTNLRLPAADKAGMELWLKPARLTGTQCVAFVGASADAGFGLWIVDGVLEGRAGTTRVSMSSALTTDDWHHVAFIVSDHTASLRVDGVEVATSSGATLPALVKGFGVGAMVDGTAPYDGLVDELRLFEVPATGFDATTQLVVNARPSVSVTQGAVDFGDVLPGQLSSTLEPRLVNAGPGWLRVVSASLTGDGAADYHYVVSIVVTDPPEPTAKPNYNQASWIYSLTTSQQLLSSVNGAGRDPVIDQGIPATSSYVLPVLPPRSHAVIEVFHTAGIEGDRPATLRIVTNDPVNPVQEIQLHARTLPSRPKLALDGPRELNWGLHRVNQSFTQNFSVVNEGSGTAHLKFSITGPNAGDVRILMSTVPSGVTATIPANPNFDLDGWSARVIMLRIEPHAAGLRAATLRIESSDPGFALVEVPLYGVAQGPEPKMEVYDPQTVLADGGQVSFGPVFSGRNAEHWFSLHNTGDADLHLTGITITGAHAADFTIQSTDIVNSLPLTLAPGSALPMNGFTVRFTPQGTGNRTATLRIESDDPAHPAFTLPLTGTGLAPAPQLSVVQPVHVLFGNGATPLGESFIRLGTGVVRGFRVQSYALPTRTIRLRNTGVTPLTNAQITFTGEAAGDFSAVITNSIGVDAAGDLTVTFNPTAVGPRSAVMHIVSGDTQVNVPVGGTGAYGEKASLLPALPQGWSTTAMVELADHSIILAGYQLGVSNGEYRLLHATADGYTFLGQGSALSFSGPIQSLAVNAKGELLVGGIFSSVSGDYRPSGGGTVITAVSTAWLHLCEGVVLITTDGQLVSDFHTPGRGLAASPMDRFSCYACVALPGGRYLVGGSGALGGRHHLVRLNADGTVDTTFTLPEPNGPVNALALQDDGKVLVGGEFTNLGQAYQSAQRRDPARSAHLYGGLLQTSGAGDFIDGEEAGLCRLNIDGSNDTTFGNPGVSRVTTLAVRGNRIAIGGEANWSTSIANTTATKIVLYLTDESGRIRAFASPERIPRAVAVQSGNRLLFAPGNQYGEMHTHPSVAMLQPTSEAADWWGVKQIFTDGLPALPVVVQNPTYRVQEFDGDVNALLAQADGKVLVGGSLTASRVAVDYSAGGFTVPASVAESNPGFWTTDASTDAMPLSGLIFGSTQATTSSMPLRGFAQLDVDGFFNSVIPEPGMSDGLSVIDVYATHPAIATTAAINTSATTISPPNGSLTFNPTFWPRVTLPDPAAGATWFIDGPDAAAFSLRDAGLMRPAYIGAPLVMDVTFTSRHAGAHRAVLHVSTPGSEVLDIALGSHLPSLPPGIRITAAEGGATQGSSETLDFGWTSEDQAVTRTLKITNTGSTAFSGPLSPSIFGGNATDFTITKQPVYPIEAGGDTEMVVTFRPLGSPSTQRAASLLLASNSSTAPFSIQLTGSAVLPLSTSALLSNFHQREDVVLLKGQSFTSAERTIASNSPISWQWFRGSTRLFNMASPSLIITDAKSTDGGAYSVQASNVTGSIKAEALRVAVIDMESKTVAALLAKPLQLECKVAGNQPVTYQWQFNGVPLSGAAFTGVDRAKLTIKSVTTSSAGDYTCIVKLGTASRASPPITLRLDVAPVLVSGLSNTTWRVTQPVNERLAFNSVTPVGIVSQGLPPGVTLNKSTGIVTGRPTKAGTYRVRFQAWNVRGHSSIVDQTITVLPWAPGFVGTFYGSVMLGAGETIGDWTLVAAGNGSFTAKLRAGSQWLPAGKDADGEPVFGGIETSSFTGSLTFVPESDSISHATATAVRDDIEQLDVTITITNGLPHAQFTRIRPGSFVTAGEAAPAMRVMPSRYAGTYASALNGRGSIEARPLAKSSLRFTFGTNRVFTWAVNPGSAFGGRSFTGSCPVMDDGSNAPCGNIFTVLPTIDGGYSLSGKAIADADSSPLTFSGQLGLPAGSIGLESPIIQWFDFTAKKAK